MAVNLSLPAIGEVVVTNYTSYMNELEDSNYLSYNYFLEGINRLLEPNHTIDFTLKPRNDTNVSDTSDPSDVKLAPDTSNDIIYYGDLDGEKMTNWLLSNTNWDTDHNRAQVQKLLQDFYQNTTNNDNSVTSKYSRTMKDTFFESFREVMFMGGPSIVDTQYGSNNFSSDKLFASFSTAVTDAALNKSNLEIIQEKLGNAGRYVTDNSKAKISMKAGDNIRFSVKVKGHPR